MQRACMGTLMELSEKDSRLLYLTADSGEGGLDRYFRLNFPNRSFEFGIAEEGLVAGAAGLALTGKIPFVFTAAPFLAYRAYEFLRNDVCIQGLNVKFLASGSGLSVGALGPTHHTTEDIAALRSLPGLTILSPVSPIQAAACVREAYRRIGPVYVRLGMAGECEPFEDGYELPIGNEVLQQGEGVAFFSTGGILKEVLPAAEMLSERTGVKPAIVNVHTLKPFDGSGLEALSKRCPLFVSVEEHNIIGGLGTILAEEILEQGLQTKLLRIGLMDVFAKSYGPTAQVRASNGLDAVSICGKIKAALSERKG